MYFLAPGFIAPLLREREPRRLFNIISSSQYIIPRQIRVYLQTRQRYTEREEEREQVGWVAALRFYAKTQRYAWVENVIYNDKLIQWQTPDGGWPPEVPCASLSHEPPKPLPSSPIPTQGAATSVRLPEVLAWLCCWTLRFCVPPEMWKKLKMNKYCIKHLFSI